MCFAMLPATSHRLPGCAIRPIGCSLFRDPFWLLFPSFEDRADIRSRYARSTSWAPTSKRPLRRCVPLQPANRLLGSPNRDDQSSTATLARGLGEAESVLKPSLLVGTKRLRHATYGTATRCQGRT
jgi:hypothetical protein